MYMISNEILLTVTKFLEKYHIVDCAVTVGLSGGADSICLVHILKTLSEKFNITVRALHLNHNLRGEESIRDENFVKDFCKKIGIELDENELKKEIQFKKKVGL